MIKKRQEYRMSKYLYALCYEDTHEFAKGGGSSSQARIRVYTSESQANGFIKRIRNDQNRKIVVVKYISERIIDWNR